MEKSPFVIYVEDMLGREAQVVIMQFSQTVAAKMEELISHGWSWRNGWIEIVVARYYSRLIWRAWLLSPLQDRDPVWDLDLGIGLVH